MKLDYFTLIHTHSCAELILFLPVQLLGPHHYKGLRAQCHNLARVLKHIFSIFIFLHILNISLKRKTFQKCHCPFSSNSTGTILGYYSPQLYYKVQCIEAMILEGT